MGYPRMGGLEAIKEIKSQQPKARILVLTSFVEDENVIEAIRAGAYGFLLKDPTPDELVGTIRTVYADMLRLYRRNSPTFSWRGRLAIRSNNPHLAI